MFDIFETTEEELGRKLVQIGEKSFRAKQIFEWIYQKGITDWDKMTNLSQNSRDAFARELSLSSLTLKQTQDSQDGETTKFLWQLKDGKLVESVLIYAPDRQTVCVSSQVGCPARCAFCASGKEGLLRNLSTGEIVAQVYWIDRFLREKGLKVTNVVFMGMGEPLENFDAVVKAIRLLSSESGFHLSSRRITVSTVGVVEGIIKLADMGMKVNLVLSLHAPNQHIRKKIIPYARKYPLEIVLDAMRYYASKSKRDITYEYTLIAGINDAEEHAEELGNLLKGQQCTVNLIPYNPIIGLRLNRPDKRVIEAFREILEEKKLIVTWRYTKGTDIAAACGQLALQKESENIIPNV